MKQSFVVAIAGFALLSGGCQSANWFSKNSSKPASSVAKSENIREVPWTWRKKKDPVTKTDLPPELAKKLEDSKRRAASPKSAEEWNAEGSEQEVARNYPAAKKAYEESLIIDPVNVTAHHRLGVLADIRKDYVVAQDHYSAALRQKPHDADILSDLGYSHHLQGNVQQSKRYLLQALDINREHQQALKNLGALYASQGWYDDAVVAFRHYRPESEAQRLLTQYFPERQSTSGANISLAGAQRPFPQGQPEDELSPGDLKGLTQAEIMQIMQQRKRASQQEREQKLMAELRPNLQPSLEEPSPADRSMAASSPATGSPLVPGRSPPSDWPGPQTPQGPWDQEPQGMNPHQPLAQHGPLQSPSGTFPSDSSPPRQSSGAATAPNVEFWTGAGVQQPPANLANSPRPNATQQMPFGSPPGIAGSSGAPSHWQNSPPEQQHAMNSSGVNPWGNSGLPQPPSHDGQLNSRQQSQSVSRQAYQLGMSAGPGMMFPPVAANSAPPAQDVPESTQGPWASSTTPGGYTEMKAPTNWEQPGSSPENSAWQNVPVNTSPQSPTENWNSPMSVPWPGNSSGSQGPRSTPVAEGVPPRMPVINPGRSAYGNPVPGTVLENQPTSSRSPDTEFRQDVVPALHRSGSADSSRGASGRAGGNSVQQWPYAPR